VRIVRFQPEPILVRAIRDEFRFDRFAGFEQAAVDGARRQRGSHKAKDSGSPSHESTYEPDARSVLCKLRKNFVTPSHFCSVPVDDTQYAQTSRGGYHSGRN
jgi:hypothetical protein